MNIIKSNMSYKQNKQGKQPSEQISPQISFVFVFLSFLCPRYYIKRDDSLLKSCTQRQLSIVPIMNMCMHTFYILALNSFLSIFHTTPPLSTQTHSSWITIRIWCFSQPVWNAASHSIIWSHCHIDPSLKALCCHRFCKNAKTGIITSHVLTLE